MLESQPQDARLARNRMIIYVVLSLILTVSFFLFRGSEWEGSQGLHTVMESIATILALTVGVLALTRFYSKKVSTFLFIGVGFLGAGVLDAYHALVTSVTFDAFFPSPSPSLAPWSWIASRFFLSFTLFLSWWLWKKEARSKKENLVDEKNIYLIASVFTLACLLFFAFVPLPRAYYPELFFGRPEEMIPALFFLLALVGYLRKGWWKTDSFEHWLVMSLIVGFISQAVFMSFSFSLFDFEFDAAHLLKKLSYIFVLIGLVISIYRLVSEVEESRQQLTQKNIEIQKAKEFAEEALEESEKSKSSLERMISMMTGRELKMRELKNKINELDPNQEKDEK